MLRPADFESTFASGLRISRKPVGLVFKANQSGPPRLGLAISKKAVPLAVQRNLLKRIIRDQFRLAAATLPPVDLIIYMQAGASSLSAAELRYILKQLWAKMIERCA